MRVNRRIATTAICLLVFSFSTALAQESFGEGTHLVGRDIQPGLYRTDGEISYFARLSGISGELSDIIANEAFPPSPVLVEIKETDIAFESQGSGTWTRIDDSYNPEIKSFFEDGWWLVGVDIESGRYRTTDVVNYFARLSGVGGELDDIIANGAFTSGPVVVDIKESDFAFQSSGDATWALLDDSYQPEIRSSFGDGWWIVDVDIEPGIYRTSDDVSYFSRLSGFGHELADIIVNKAFTSGSSIIEIMSTDTGFETQGGATWNRVDLTLTKIESATWGTIKFRQHK